MADRRLEPRTGHLHRLFQAESRCHGNAHEIEEVGKIVLHGQAPGLDAGAQPPTGRQPTEHGKNEQEHQTHLQADGAAHQGDEAETEPEHGRSHLYGDELLGPDRSGQAGLEQIGMHPIDLAGRVEPRQNVLECPCGWSEDASEQRGLDPLNHG